MDDRSARRLKRYLPHAVAATAVVIVLPIGVMSLLVSGGLIDSVFVTGPVAMLISLGASWGGGSWWKKRRASHELVFSDLMIWGWLRRLRNERRISRAAELLGDNVELPTEQQIAYFKQLANALEARDPYTHGHTRRVTAHAVAIAERLGLSRDQIAKIRTAAAIHDIGKLNTPREVLNKPGQLSDEEFAVIKRHPAEGAEMAARLGDPDITAMVLHHHERLDGTGYPGRLAGETIPLGARIIAVADTFDAITSKRPYRGASSHKKGMTILDKEAGTQLDPEAVKAFRSHYSGLRGVAIGSLVSSGPGQLLPWRWGLSSVAPAAKSLAAVAIAGALGTTAAGLAKPAPAAQPRPVAAARARDVARVDLVTPVTGAGKPSRPATASAASRRPSLHHPAKHRGISHPPARLRPTSPTHRSNGPGVSLPSSNPTSSVGGGGAPGGGSSSHGGGPGATGRGSGSNPSAGGSGGSSGSGGSTGGGGAGGSTGPVAVSTTPPAVSASQGTVTTPSVTITTPLGTASTPSVTSTTPSVSLSDPAGTVPTPSVP